MSNSESSEPHIFFDGSDKSEAMSCYREALNAGAKNLAMTVTGLTAGHFLAKKYCKL